MLPVLVSIGSFKLYSYGVFLLVALFVGLYWWWKLGRDENMEETSLFDAFFVALLSGFVVGRAVYVLMHLADFGNIYRILGVLAFPGMSLVGTILGVVVTVFLIARYQEWEIAKTFDNLFVTLGVILAIGSLGGVMNGSLLGIPVSWGISYPGVAGARFPLDFVQLLWAIMYFGVVSRVRKDFRFYAWYKQGRTVAPDGLAALVGMGLLGTIYLVRGFLEETWRVGPISYYTILGFVIVLTAGVAIYLRSGRTLLFKK